MKEDQRSELDALSLVITDDSRRIDKLVGDVSDVKGKVDRVDKNVDELRTAMAVLVKHEVVMEQNAREVSQLRAEQGDLSRRLYAVEAELPQLKETRGWVIKAVLAVAGVVGLAIVALVVKAG